MQITSKFTIAIHILAAIDTFHGHVNVNSKLLSQSIGANPVIVRGVMSDLKKAGIIMSHRGKNDVTIEKPLDQVSFYDIYQAVNANDKDLFHFHENLNQKCPVGKNIHHVLDKRLLEVQRAMEEKISEMTLADVKKDIAMYTEKE